MVSPGSPMPQANGHRLGDGTGGAGIGRGGERAQPAQEKGRYWGRGGWGRRERAQRAQVREGTGEGAGVREGTAETMGLKGTSYQTWRLGNDGWRDGGVISMRLEKRRRWRYAFDHTSKNELKNDGWKNDGWKNDGWTKVTVLGSWAIHSHKKQLCDQWHDGSENDGYVKWRF